MPLKLMTPGAAVPFATADTPTCPAVTGTVRPPTPEEVAEYDARAGRAEGGPLTRTRAGFFATHIRTWDVQDGGGAAAAVTPRAVLLLPYPAFVRLEEAVLGAMPAG